jgi:hypothetical protein
METRARAPWMTPRQGKADVVHFFETAGQMEILDLQVLHMMEGATRVSGQSFRR